MPNPLLQAELLALRDPETGLLRTDVVHDWAEANPESEIHRHLEWDDAIAGREWRLQQIRHLVVVHMVDDHGHRTEVSLRVDRVRQGGGYRALADVLPQPDMVDQLLDDASRDAMHFVKRYEHLRGISGSSGDRLFVALDEFVAEREALRIRRSSSSPGASGPEPISPMA